MQVFISYNNSDSEAAKEIGSILNERNINYFLDSKDIPYGKPIADSVKDAFETATHLVVMISPGSAQSEWVSFEIGMATGKGIPVLPVLTHPKMELPAFINNLKYFKTVDEFKENFDLKSDNTPMNTKRLHKEKKPIPASESTSKSDKELQKTWVTLVVAWEITTQRMRKVFSKIVEIESSNSSNNKEAFDIIKALVDEEIQILQSDVDSEVADIVAGRMHAMVESLSIKIFGEEKQPPLEALSFIIKDYEVDHSEN